MGVNLLYCFYATPISQWKASYKSADVPDAIRACSSTLAILAERWTEAECVRDVFEILAREIPHGETWERPVRLTDAGRAGIEANWKKVGEIIINRPTLYMIHEIATQDFVQEAKANSDDTMSTTEVASPNIASFLFGEVDLGWDDHSHTPSFAIGARFDTGVDIDALSGQI
jgi:hypothetical protein